MICFIMLVMCAVEWVHRFVFGRYWVFRSDRQWVIFAVAVTACPVGIGLWHTIRKAKHD